MKNAYFLFFSIFFLSLQGFDSQNPENPLNSDEQFEQRLSTFSMASDHVGPKIKLLPETFEALRQISADSLKNKENRIKTLSSPSAGPSSDIKKLLQKPVSRLIFDLPSIYDLESTKITISVNLREKQIAKQNDLVAGFCMTGKSNSNRMQNVPTHQFDNRVSIARKRNNFYIIFTGDPNVMYPIAGVVMEGTVNGKPVRESCTISDINPLVTVAESIVASQAAQKKLTHTRNSDDEIANNLFVIFENRAIVNKFKHNPGNATILNILKSQFPKESTAVYQKMLNQILYKTVINDTNSDVEQPIL